MPPYDRRLHAYRADLADERLRGHVEAERFVTGKPYHVTADALSLRAAASPMAAQDSELLFGESVAVFEVAEGWAWLQNEADGYVGYAVAAGLSPGPAEPTHRVAALRTYLYHAPDLKAPAAGLLSMNAAISSVADDGPFAKLADGRWIWAAHLAPNDAFEAEHGTVALRFAGTPYLWGGRTSVGLDCSALVQMALARCGVAAPRDTDMQAALGAAVPYDGDQAALRRGDLVFWPGHVGIWLDPDRLVHANAGYMTTVVEPLAEAERRIRAATGDAVSAVRRP